MTEMSAADLVLLARNGDREAWDALVERFSALVWAVCRRYRLSEADARDVTQTVWLALLEHIAKLREPAALPGWLATTCARECLRVLRMDSVRTFADIAEHDLPSTGTLPSPEEAVVTAERRDAVRTAFALLPEGCRRLLALLATDPPMSYVEIGRRLGKPVGALGPTRARCLAKLRRSEPIATLIRDETARDGGRDR